MRPSHNDTPLLCFLLDRLFILSWGRNSASPIQLSVASCLVQELEPSRTRPSAIYTMRKYYPYLGFGRTLRLLPGDHRRQSFGRLLIARQRPFGKI